MNVFLAATDVHLLIDLVDNDGNPLNVSSIKYRVTNAAGVEQVPLTVASDFVPGSTQIEVDVPAVKNTLAAGAARDLRAVELQCVVDGNTIVLQSSYVIQVAEPLVIGLNSFQTLAMAEFNAQTIPNLPGWTEASSQERQAALIDARRRICQLAFSSFALNRDQSSLLYEVEGARPAIFGDVTTSGLEALTPSQFVLLPERFRAALCLAQITEADAILGGDPVDEKRRAGIVLDTVGESKQMFRSTAPLDLPVCRRALAYLAGYVSFAKRIARG